MEMCVLDLWKLFAGGTGNAELEREHRMLRHIWVGQKEALA